MTEGEPVRPGRDRQVPGRRPNVVRSGQWWNHKLAPIIGVGAVAILRNGSAGDVAAVGDLLLLVAAACGLAAFGHVINDWADIDLDAKADKPNVLASWSRLARVVLLAVTVGGTLAAWLALAPDRRATGLFVAEVVLLVAYSVPPVRLKARGLAGVLADAAYAYAVPFAITVAALHPSATNLAVGAVAAFGFLMGLRGILWHQRLDLETDGAAGVRTAAVRIGAHRVEVLVADVILPLELALLVLVVVAVSPWAVALLGFALVYRTFQLTVLWLPPLDLRTLRSREVRVHVLGYEVVNTLVEGWLPVAALVALAVDGTWWWWCVLVVHLLVFHTIVRQVLVEDIGVLPDAIRRVLHRRAIERDLRTVAASREAAVAAGPRPLDDPTARRWVFVVCGPAVHIETLATAVEHLRPITLAEIWVLTDRARNEVPIAPAGIDGVVDIATPVELDDHQASIWLKTSVHRHLPEGEWCYLDTDVIAVRPGVEEVFDHRKGPVAFASDTMMQENCVDRFSPWAMTCSCLADGDDDSCGHLRQQLATRFGLEVPGDWLHWNGGVFVFGPEGAGFLDEWHERAVTSFSWPEWRTRDQGTLISTVWSWGLQDQPRLPLEFNFIADLGARHLCLDAERGWAHHESGPWLTPRFMHLYTSALEDPEWDLATDVEAVVLRRSWLGIRYADRHELQKTFEQRVERVRTAIVQAVIRGEAATRRAVLTAASKVRRAVIPERLWRRVNAQAAWRWLFARVLAYRSRPADEPFPSDES